MQYFDFVAPYAEEPNLPFPEDIANCPSVLYHGTSGAAAARIESIGLQPDQTFSLEEIASVVAVFEMLRWDGTGASCALSDLRAYGTRDRLPGGLRPVFLATSSARATRYAKEDRAGGEMAQHIRVAFSDLSRYLHDPSVRHARDQASPRVDSEASPQSVGLGDRLHRLEDALVHLDHLRVRAEGAQQRHGYGIVYAVRFGGRDRRFLYRNGTDVCCRCPIPADRIVGATRVPHEFEWSRLLWRGEASLPAQRFVELLGWIEA